MKVWRLGRPAATSTNTTTTTSSAAAATSAGEGNKSSSSNNNNSSIALECVYTYNPFNGASVTTIDITTSPSGHNSDPSLSTSEYRIALGCETGDISIYTLTITTITTTTPINNSDNTTTATSTTTTAGNNVLYNIQLLCSIPDYYTHGASVTKIRWAPDPQSIGGTLASCSEDHTVRVYKLSE